MRQVIKRTLRKAPQKVVDESGNAAPTPRYDFTKAWTFDVPPLGDIKARDRQNRDSRTMNRNVLYLVIGALAVAAVVTGYLLYQEQQKISSIELNLDKNGVSVETK